MIEATFVEEWELRNKVPELFFKEAAADNELTPVKIAMEAEAVEEIASIKIPTTSISFASVERARCRHLLMVLKPDASLAISFSTLRCDLREDTTPSSSPLRKAD